MRKRYLRDYPESDKTYDTEHGKIFVKDSTGCTLVVPVALQDRLVLKDFSETPLQQLARRYVLMEYPAQEEYTLQRQMVDVFGEESTRSAVKAFFNENSNLHSSEVRRFAAKLMAVKGWIDERNKWWDKNTYIGEDGERHSKDLPNKATFFDVVKEIGRSVFCGYAALQRNYQNIVSTAKVSAVALAFFFVGGGLAGSCVSWLLGFGIQGIILATVGGAVADVAYEIGRLAVNIRADRSYLAWKDSIEKPILDSFRAVLENYGSFEALRCPTTFDFPAIAVRDSFGRLYDQKAIYQWIDTHRTHPVTRERMNREDVTFDMDYASRLQEAMETAFGSANFTQINTENSEEEIERLKAALNTAIDDYNEIIFTRAQQAYSAARATEMPRVEAQQLYIANLEAFVRLPRYDVEEERV